MPGWYADHEWIKLPYSLNTDGCNLGGARLQGVKGGQLQALSRAVRWS